MKLNNQNRKYIRNLCLLHVKGERGELLIPMHPYLKHIMYLGTLVYKALLLDRENMQSTKFMNTSA